MLIRTRKEICRYIGEDTNRFLELVNNFDLPCWQTFEGGTWKALTRHLDIWLLSQATKHTAPILKRLEALTNLKTEDYHP